MKRIVLLAWAKTDWEAQGRLTGNIDLSLNAEGQQQALNDAEVLAAQFAPAAVFCGPEDAARQTASTVARRCDLRVHKRQELHEVDLGHWEGLTETEFRERFPKAYRQWREDPVTVCPPEGETLVAAAARLGRALAKALRRSGEGDVIVVCGPLAAVVLRLHREKQPLGRFWECLEERRRWVAIELPAEGNA